MSKYYQPEIETMPVDQLQALQSERLVAQVKHVYDNENLILPSAEGHEEPEEYEWQPVISNTQRALEDL